MIYIFTSLNIFTLLLIIYCIVGALFELWPAPLWLCVATLIMAILVKIWNIHTIGALKNESKYISKRE